MWHTNWFLLINFEFFYQYTPLLKTIPHDVRLIVASKSNYSEICKILSETFSGFLLSKLPSSSSLTQLSSPPNKINVKLIDCAYQLLQKVQEAIAKINSGNNVNNKDNNKGKIMIELGIFDEV